MPLYDNRQVSLKEVSEQPFRLEKEIQKIFENNLGQIMNLEFVKSEFTIKNRRIDTLAFDQQSKGFIIIEYKRDKNVSVIDQGFTYLSLMLENKADFIVEYNEAKQSRMKRDDVDWSQTRVAFVSTNFTENQIRATNFKDIAIELWEIKQFVNGTVSINSIKKTSSAESVKPITQQTKELKAVSDEIKVYTEEEHLLRINEDTSELYEKLKSGILNLIDDITVKPKKNEVGFIANGKIFSDVIFNKSNLKVMINLKRGMLDDPKKLARDVTSTGHWGNGDYQITLEGTENIEYVLSLIKQAIKR